MWKARRGGRSAGGDEAAVRRDCEEGIEIERVAVVPVYADKLPPSGLVRPR